MGVLAQPADIGSERAGREAPSFFLRDLGAPPALSLHRSLRPTHRTLSGSLRFRE